MSAQTVESAISNSTVPASTKSTRVMHSCNPRVNPQRYSRLPKPDQAVAGPLPTAGSEPPRYRAVLRRRAAVHWVAADGTRSRSTATYHVGASVFCQAARADSCDWMTRRRSSASIRRQT